MYKICTTSSQPNSQHGWGRSLRSPIPIWRAIDSWWLLGVGESLCFRDVGLQRLTMLQMMATYPYSMYICAAPNGSMDITFLGFLFVLKIDFFSDNAFWLISFLQALLDAPHFTILNFLFVFVLWDSVSLCNRGLAVLKPSVTSLPRNSMTFLAFAGTPHKWYTDIHKGKI